MSAHTELIRADRYYHSKAAGWVVLVNGTPHHYTGQHAKREALEHINALNKRQYQEAFA